MRQHRHFWLRSVLISTVVVWSIALLLALGTGSDENNALPTLVSIQNQTELVTQNESPPSGIILPTAPPDVQPLILLETNTSPQSHVTTPSTLVNSSPETVNT